MTRSGRQVLPRLIVLTRYPRPGEAKTRLAPLLGAEGAAALHSELARHCVRRMHAAALSGCATLEVHVSGADARETRRWLGREVTVRPQPDGDLGERLAACARAAFAKGAPSVVLVGSDAPGLGGAQVRASIAALANADIALGPAHDGGYYLLAVRAQAAPTAIPALFGPHVPWGTDCVLEASASAARKAGLTVELLEPLGDVDRPEDLELWESVRREQSHIQASPRVSVVIPALNEGEVIADAIRSAARAGTTEIIVADAGSTDDTAERARELGALVVESARGRARQLNAGARAASGDVLLFLHADTTLPPDALEHVRRLMADPDVALGAFRFSAGSRSSFLDRLISAVGDWRHRLSRLPYGDQGMFVRAQDFDDLGGFPDLPVMEDYEFSLRCSRLGRITSAPSAVRTSTRAWREHGVTRTTLTNMAVIAGYRLGVNPATLAAWRSRIAGGRQP